MFLAYEISHHLLNKRNGGVKLAAVKADMSKAYDRVEWAYLRAIMLKLGFTSPWVDFIMKCVTLVRYQIKVNNSYTYEFCPKSGLR